MVDNQSQGQMLIEGDEPSCVVCGDELVWVECHMHDCEEGSYDAYEEDPLWYNPGDREVCGECNGRGGWWFCDRCNTERRPGPPRKEMPGAKL